MEKISAERQLSCLELPPTELRSRIYYFAVIEDRLVEATIAQHKKWVKQPKINQPALAGTCRQIRDETLAVYYANNTLTLTNLSSTMNLHRCIAEWLASVGTHVQNIYRIAFEAPRGLYAVPRYLTERRRIKVNMIATIRADTPIKLEFDPAELEGCGCSERSLNAYQGAGPNDKEHPSFEHNYH